MLVLTLPHREAEYHMMAAIGETKPFPPPAVASLRESHGNGGFPWIVHTYLTGWRSRVHVFHIASNGPLEQGRWLGYTNPWRLHHGSSTMAHPLAFTADVSTFPEKVGPDMTFRGELPPGASPKLGDRDKSRTCLDQPCPGANFRLGHFRYNMPRTHPRTFRD